MPPMIETTTSRLSRLIGLPNATAIVDVRSNEDYHADTRLMPDSRRRDHKTIATSMSAYKGKGVVVACQKGQKHSQGTGAWLRHDGVDAQILDAGFDARKKANKLLLRTEPRDEQGRTVWVTRAHPRIDYIACPWLIRRFVDPNAVFLFVLVTEVTGVAEHYNATPFDIEGVFWSHPGDNRTFDTDTMIEEFSLRSQPLLQRAKIVRGADTVRPDPHTAVGPLLAAPLDIGHVSPRPSAARCSDNLTMRSTAGVEMLHRPTGLPTSRELT